MASLASGQLAPDPSIFHRYILDRCATLKAQHPSLTRRSLLLLSADEFWSLDARSWAALVAAGTVNKSEPISLTGNLTTISSAQTGTDGALPPWVSEVEHAATAEDDDDDVASPPPPPPGIVLRTDYGTGSDDAWAAFCGAVREAEREFLADQEGSASSASAPAVPVDGDDDVEMAPVHVPPTGSTKTTEEEEKEEESSNDEEGDEEELALFSLFSDPARFDHISNLRALRLLFDVSVRSAPAAPAPSYHDTPARHRQQQQQQQQHRLTCLRGLQETYDTHGRTLWIFDSRSRTDGCARLVSEAGDVATGDSWRARVTHMAELQASLAARALRIDFGGLDRWDFVERQRNIREADAGYTAALSETR